MQQLSEVEQKLHAAEVEHHLRRLRANAEARRLFDQERAGTPEPFDAGSLAEILARDPEPQHRIDGLQPWDSSVLLVAQRKTGKTTLTANWARSLLTGEPFLGRHDVRPLQGNVAILNFEVSGQQLAHWLNDAKVPSDRCFVVNLRGRRNPLHHDEDRASLAWYLRNKEIEALAVDPFGRAFTGSSQNDAGEVGAWLVGLDEFVRSDVGATDLLLTAHAGWNGERVRGASALEDWADAIWNLTQDEASGTRFFRALGRDVDIDEDALDYDDAKRALTLTGHGSRKHAATARQDEEARQVIVELLSASPAGLSGKGLADGAARKDKDFTRVREALVADGTISATRRAGRGGGMVYRLNLTTSRNLPELTEPACTEPTEPLPIRGGSGSVGTNANLPNHTGGAA